MIMSRTVCRVDETVQRSKQPMAAGSAPREGTVNAPPTDPCKADPCSSSGEPAVTGMPNLAAQAMAGDKSAKVKRSTPDKKKPADGRPKVAQKQPQDTKPAGDEAVVSCENTMHADLLTKYLPAAGSTKEPTKRSASSTGSGSRKKLAATSGCSAGHQMPAMICLIAASVVAIAA